MKICISFPNVLNCERNCTRSTLQNVSLPIKSDHLIHYLMH